MKHATIANIIARATQEHAGIDEDLLRRAERFAREAHAGQKRENGDPFIVHPRAVAFILADLGVDTPTIAAGLLHDVIEDTDVSHDELTNAFGEEIAWLCDGVTKLQKFEYKGVEREVENLRKFFLAMAEDIRVVLVKLADRLHNMMTLQYLPPAKARRKARETMEIYAPIAGRLGIWEMKGALEDLAFPFIDPDAYRWTKEKLSSRIKEREAYLNRIAPKLKRALKKEGVEPIDIQARAKTYWSSYQKLQQYDMDVDHLYDLVAMRVIVETVEECYATLGIVHSLWSPIPDRIKDYIATPKPNGYQALHTTVFADDGEMTEVQIRTRAMHEEAEHGIAAHWAYVEAGKPERGATANKKRLEWIRQLREWQQEVKGGKEFLESLKIDFFENRIFVFTPKGDIVDLPRGATPLDFAYHIHSEVGDHCAGARVDGKMTGLDEPLESGSVVDIVTRKDAHPTRDWLTTVTTSTATSKIRRWLRENAQPDEPPETEQPTDHEQPEQDPASWPQQPSRRQRSSTAGHVIVDGHDNLKTHLAQCCHPLPGHEIVGYTTQRGSISIHRINCSNLQHHPVSRQIDAVWRQDAMHEQTLRLSVEDRVGMLKEISAVISEAGLNITDIHTRPSKSNTLATMDVTLLISDVAQVNRAIRHLREVDGIVDIKRV